MPQTKAVAGSPRRLTETCSIEVAVRPLPRAIVMNGQGTPVELLHALGCAHHVGLADVGENRHVAPPGSAEGGDAVEGVAAAEDLQVARLEVENLHPVGCAIQDAGDFSEVLVALADAGRILEGAASLGILYGERHSEVIGVEVPGKAVSLLGHVDDDVGQWIGVAVEVTLLEAVLDKAVKALTVVDGAEGTILREVVGRHECVRAIKELPPGVVSWETWVVLREVDIGAVEAAVAPVCDAVSFSGERGNSRGRQELLYDSAAVTRQVSADPLQQGVAHWPLPVNRVALVVYQLRACVRHLHISKALLKGNAYTLIC